MASDTGSSSEKKVCQIDIYENGKLNRTLDLSAKMKSIGEPSPPLRWSHDGRTIFMVYTKALDNDKIQCGLIEVPVNGGALSSWS